MEFLGDSPLRRDSSRLWWFSSASLCSELSVEDDLEDPIIRKNFSSSSSEANGGLRPSAPSGILGLKAAGIMPWNSGWPIGRPLGKKGDPGIELGRGINSSLISEAAICSSDKSVGSPV